MPPGGDRSQAAGREATHRYQVFARCCRSGGSDPDAGVDGDAAARQAEYRVQVELDLGDVVGEPGEAEHEVDQRAGIRRRLPAEAGDEAPRLARRDQLSASAVVSGAMRNCTWPISSAKTPPGPKATSGPKVGSWTTPASSSAAHRGSTRSGRGTGAPIRSTASRRTSSRRAKIERHDPAGLGLVRSGGSAS